MFLYQGLKFLRIGGTSGITLQQIFLHIYMYSEQLNISATGLGNLTRDLCFPLSNPKRVSDAL